MRISSKVSHSRVQAKRLSLVNLGMGPAFSVVQPSTTSSALKLLLARLKLRLIYFWT